MYLGSMYPLIASEPMSVDASRNPLPGSTAPHRSEVSARMARAESTRFIESATVGRA
jgi:hypothetical protein